MRMPSLIFVMALALGGGCAGYRLGPTNRELTGGKTIQVNFFENRTREPRLVEAVSHALRLLRAHRVVSVSRRGRMAFYRLDDAHVRMLLDLGLTHIAHTGALHEAGGGQRT